MIFNAHDYAELHDLVFREGYPGYRPHIVEAPAGDGNLDHTKRYAHVAPKYLEKMTPGAAQRRLAGYYYAAYVHARAVAERLGVPAAFAPTFEHSALRVLEYPPGAGSARHTDFDLFTTLCYRSGPGLVRLHGDELDAIDPGLHIGRLGECYGLGAATPHWVDPSDYRQYSIVFFAIPDHRAHVTDPAYGATETVGGWLDRIMKDTRHPAPAAPQCRHTRSHGSGCLDCPATCGADGKWRA